MGLSRNHFQLNSGRSPVRSQLRPFSSRGGSTHPSRILIGRSPWRPTIARDAGGRWSVAPETLHLDQDRRRDPRTPRLIYSTDPWRRTLGANRGSRSETPRDGSCWSEPFESHCKTTKSTRCPTGGQVVAGSNGRLQIRVYKSHRVQPCRRNSRTDGIPTPGPSQLPGHRRPHA